MVPPDAYEAHFHTDRPYPVVDRYLAEDGEQILSQRIVSVAGVTQADAMSASTAILASNERVVFESGFAHGRSLIEETQVYT